MYEWITPGKERGRGKGGREGECIESDKTFIHENSIVLSVTNCVALFYIFTRLSLLSHVCLFLSLFCTFVFPSTHAVLSCLPARQPACRSTCLLFKCLSKSSCMLVCLYGVHVCLSFAVYLSTCLPVNTHTLHTHSSLLLSPWCWCVPQLSVLSSVSALLRRMDIDTDGGFNYIIEQIHCISLVDYFIFHGLICAYYYWGVDGLVLGGLVLNEFFF